jgi:uncharacterized lipoprotein YmbA
MNDMTDKAGKALDTRREPTNAADAMGLWFAAVALCAALAAGVIVYQTGSSDMVTAANDATPAAHGSTH